MSNAPLRLAQIEQLVQLKYPAIQYLNALGTLGDIHTAMEEADTYRAKLKSLPTEQFQGLYKEIKSASHVDSQPRNVSAQHDLFEQSLRAGLDYVYWAKMAYWTPAETAAITLGLVPEATRRASQCCSHELPAIIAEYRKLRELIRRLAITSHTPQHQSRVSPVSYLEWAARHHVHIQDELERLIRQFHGNPPAVKPLHPKERETFLKLIGGLAICGYGYDPKSAKSATVREIHGDLALRGILLDEDTIRHKLQAAGDVMSVDREPDRNASP